MMGSREGFRARRRRKRAARERLAAKAEMARAETRERAAASKGSTPGRRPRRRRQQRRRVPLREAFDGRRRAELWAWLKLGALEIRRKARAAWAPAAKRLRPARAAAARALGPVGRAAGSALRLLGRGAHTALAPIAPYVSAGLFLALRALCGLLVRILDGFAWARERLLAVAAATRRWADAHLTPARAFAAVAAVAAVALAVSQPLDYRATAIGAEQYEGVTGAVADTPEVDRQAPTDAHSYWLLGLAALALPLIWLALRGRPRLAWAVAALGAAGLIVTLAVDLPQGLDTGTAGDTYEGTEARLLTGFWLQLLACATLLLSGAALARTQRQPGRDGRRAAAGQPPDPGRGTGPRRGAAEGAGA